MYYEESWINGVLHWRGTPDGAWHPAGLDLLNRRLREEMERRDDVSREQCITRLEQCARHMGLPIQLTASYYPPVRTVCPNCQAESHAKEHKVVPCPQCAWSYPCWKGIQPCMNAPKIDHA